MISRAANNIWTDNVYIEKQFYQRFDVQQTSFRSIYRFAFKTIL